MPGNVFVNSPAPDEPIASSLRNVYASSPTAAYGEPVFLSTERSAARINETKKDTQSFTAIPTPRFAGHVPTWNPPSFAEGSYPQNYVVEQPKNQISDMHFDKFPMFSSFPAWRTSFKTEMFLCSNYNSETMRWIEEVDVADFGGRS